jgi:hypothetical protein
VGVSCSRVECSVTNYLRIRGRGSVLGIVIRLRAGRPKNRVSIPSRKKEFSVLWSMVSLASYSVGSVGSFVRNTAAGT